MIRDKIIAKAVKLRNRRIRVSAHRIGRKGEHIRLQFKTLCYGHDRRPTVSVESLRLTVEAASATWNLIANVLSDMAMQALFPGGRRTETKPKLKRKRKVKHG